MADQQNPFSVTRAVDFDDQQIMSSWVELPGEGGAQAMAKPSSQTPMIILGGKGSGKTHLMRFLSTVAQVKAGRRDEAIAAGHVGIYMLCGGINPSRFAGKGQSMEAWTSLFHYYMDLTLAERCLDATAALYPEGSVGPECERLAATGMVALFDRWPFGQPSSRAEVAARLVELRRSLDFDVNNCARTRSITTEINVTAPSLVFGVPRVLASSIPQLRDTLFVYLIDELENLLEWQQRYANSLVRENSRPCSVKIGAKLFGMKTYATFSADEELKEGSEYELLMLDDRFRQLPTADYQEFVVDLCARRLELSNVPVPLEKAERIAWFKRQFSELKRTEYGDGEASFVLERPDKPRPWLTRMAKYVARVAPSSEALVLASLSCPEHPVVERYAVHVLYQDWRLPGGLAQTAAVIRAEMDRFLAGDRSRRFAAGFKSWRHDMLAQIRRDYQKPQLYVGLQTLVALSHGLPRNLLVLLKHVYGWALFRNERPFLGGVISDESQRLGVRDASEWFFKDARMAGPDGVQMREAVSRLAELMKTIRYSDKPAEVSLCAFSLPMDALSETAQHVLGLAEKWSLLSSVDGGRPGKNSLTVKRKFRLNPLLSTHWALSISVRGDLELSAADAETVLTGTRDSFDAFLKERTSSMNGPAFGAKVEGEEQASSLALFGDDDA